MTMTKQNVSRPGSQYKQWVISKNGVPVGVIEKFPNSRSETHPYKVFKGVPAVELVAFVYKFPVNDPKGGPYAVGGMPEAMALLA